MVTVACMPNTVAGVGMMTGAGVGATAVSGEASTVLRAAAGAVRAPSVT